MEYKHNALEIVSAASRRFGQPHDPIPAKIAVHIELNNSPAECYKIEFDRGKFSLVKGLCSESGEEDRSAHMSALAENQNNLGKVFVYSGEKAVAEYESLDQFWEIMFKAC